MADNTVGQARIELVPDLTGFRKEAARKVRAMDPVEAKVRLVPDLTGFRREATREAQAAVADVEVTVKVVPDVRGFRQALRRELNNGPIPAVEVDVQANTTQFQREIRRATSTSPPVNVRVNADTARAATQIGILARPRTSTLNIDADTGMATTQVGILGAMTAMAGGAAMGAGAAFRGMGASAVMAGVSGAASISLIGLAVVGIIGLLGIAAGAIGILGVGLLGLGVAAVPALGAIALGFEGIKTAAGAAKAGFDELKSAMTTTLQDTMRPGFEALGSLMSAIIPQAQAVGVAFGGVFTSLSTLLRDELMGELRSMMDGMAAFLNMSLPGLERMVIGFMNLGDVFGQYAGAIGQGFGNMLGELGAVFTRLESMGTLGALFASLGPVLEATGRLVGGLVEGLALAGQVMAPILGPLLDSMTAVLPGIGLALGAIGNALSQVLIALMPIFAPISALLVQIAPVLATALVPVAQALVNVVTLLAPLIAQYVSIIAPVVSQIIVMVAQILVALLPTVQVFINLMAQMAPIFVQLIGHIANLVIMLAPVMTQIITALVPIVPVLAQAFLDLIGALMPLMPQLVQLAVDLMPVLGFVVQYVVIPAIQFLAWFIIPFLVAAAEGLIGVLGWVVDVLVRVKGWLETAGRAVLSFGDWMARMGAIVREKGAEVLGWFQELPGRIRGWLGDAGSWLIDTGKSLIDGLVHGIKSVGGQVKDAILDLVPDAIEGPIRKALGIKSPSRVMMEVGGYIGEGLAIGMENQVPMVQATGMELAAAADPSTPAGAKMPTTDPTIPAVSPVVPVTPQLAPVEDPLSIDAVALAASVKTSLETVAAPAWESYGQTVQTVQSSTLLPSMGAIGSTMVATSGTVATALAGMDMATWNTGNTMAAVSSGVIAPAMGGVNASVSQTGGVVASVTGGTIIPAWSNAGAQIRNVQVGPMETAFRETRDSVNYTAATFGPAADNIAVQWGRLREGTAAPVRWSIQNVFNDGVVGSWNAVSDLLGTKKMGPYPIRFATGGEVPGQGNTDKVPALLMPGEFVLRKSVVENLGIRNLKKINEGADPQGGLPDLSYRDVAARYAAGGVVRGTPAWEQIKRGYDWARSRHGRPYVLGGSANGGGGTDCSGFMSGIANVIGGGDGRRQWATMAFNNGGNAQQPRGPQGFVAGLAAGFSIGVKNGGPAGGHTAGTIGGLEGMPPVNVESGGSPSMVKFGVGAVGADHSQFPTKYHLPLVGDSFQTGGAGGGSVMSMAEMVAEKTDPIWKKVGEKVAATNFPGMTKPIPKGYMDSFKGAQDKKIKELADAMSTFSDPGGAGVQRWRPLVETLLKRYGHSLSNTDLTLRRMNQESGGNPRAINNWDSNAKAGTPSKGLMQVIDPTFAANRDPQLSPDIWDPMANVASSMRYAMRRYGSLAAAYNRSGGYDAGGWLDPGVSTIYNGFTKPEAILSPAESERFVNIADAFLDANMAGGSFVGQHVENQYVTDVDEIQARSRRGVRRAMKEAGIRGT